ncbi:MAG: YaeQ family protein [Halioglobus sp.]|nr:YaeQ family protein [Halioglobus sp.]
MALKPTIYKAQVALADSDKGHYEQFSLTLACHPSETLERMTARLLVYCLQWQAGLAFTRGLSSADEPDLWLRDDSGDILHWIEIGQPEEPRLRKACGRASAVSVFAFGNGATTWWKRNADAISMLERVTVWSFDWREVSAASTLIERNTQLSVSISGGTLYVDNGSRNHSLDVTLLHGEQ